VARKKNSKKGLTRPRPPRRALRKPASPVPRRWTDQDDAFLQSIRDNPDDDTPRLVYADWLDEQGEADRAELIRVQCELARQTNQSEHQQRLRLREQELLAHAFSLWSRWQRLFYPPGLRFQRGFVEELSCTVGTFCLEGGPVCRYQPIRKVIFTDATISTEQCRELANCPALEHIRELKCYFRIPDAQHLQVLLASLYRTGLTALGLQLGDPNGRISRATVQQQVEVLAAAPLLGRLTRLDLGESELGPEGLRVLLESPHFFVRELGLRGDYHREFDGSLYYQDAYTTPNIGADGVILLANTPAVSRLRLLDLVHNGVNGLAVQALLASQYLDNLTRLALLECDSPEFDTHREALHARFGMTLQLAAFPSPRPW
jgi:uncharacterized protein (TIGR02996 family)